MDLLPTLPLVDRLQVCAALWAQANEASIARLAKAVINDGAFFDRLGDRGPTTATLEKFASFLAVPANWPDGQVPDDAVQFAHVCGVSAGAGVASAGKAGDSSPDAVAA